MARLCRSISVTVTGNLCYRAERSAAGKRDVRPSVCASLPRAVAGRARAGESVGELAPLRVTLESPWRILHRGILIPVTGHRPQCLLALARSKQVPSCDSECIIVSSDFILIAFEILVTYIILEKAKYKLCEQRGQYRLWGDRYKQCRYFFSLFIRMNAFRMSTIGIRMYMENDLVLPNVYHLYRRGS